MTHCTVRARWVVPVEGAPIENGLVSMAAGRIVAVERAVGGACADADYGNAVVLPGFVNAHTHLDLTAFRGCVPYLGSFTDWLRILVSMQTADGGQERMDAGIQVGLRESLAAGVTCIADIGCGQRAVEAWRGAGAHIFGFFEAIGMGPRRYDDHPRSLQRALACLEAVSSLESSSAIQHAASNPAVQPRRVLIGSISPHAPYSTAPEVYCEAVTRCRTRRLPICTHLAETPDEIEFLARGTGPFRTLLEDRGLWDGSFAPPGCSPVEYAQKLGLLECAALLAHGNYLSDSDISLLAARRASVVYCPRTHRFFRHAPHPFRRLQAAGVNVCLGTDSLASTPTLSILDEMRFLRQIYATGDPDTLIEMGTLNGARALSVDTQIGSLVPGKRADLAVVPLDHASAADPLDDLLGSDLPAIAVYRGGVLV